MNLKTIAINLKKRPDRWALCQAECARVGLSVERFDAIELPTSDSRFKKPGLKGCSFSHIEAWKYLNKQGTLPALILEDDAVFCKDFSKHLTASLTYSVKAGMPWDILYLNNNNNRKLAKAATTPVLEIPAGQWCLHAYIITQSFLDKVLPIEPALRKAQSMDAWLKYNKSLGLKKYTTKVYLSKQRKGYSDVQKRNTTGGPSGQEGFR